MSYSAYLTFEDLEPLAPGLSREVAEIIISDVEAQAFVAAPCIADPLFEYRDQVLSILRQAALRWHRAGDGGLSSETLSSGPFARTQSMDTRSSGMGRLYPSEQRQLQDLCRLWRSETGSRRKAFTVLPRRR